MFLLPKMITPPKYQNSKIACSKQTLHIEGKCWLSIFAQEKAQVSIQILVQFMHDHP